ncbi:hypothetical protein [Natronococcus occultus]|uniref:Uncharacterized protein n=1 Tax=Natronococcus occultus SP4 TaxID=694430 RepID=L0JW74_9EURY|nr:hypothetical protein [Natronococcus occultus]AGB36118.1 hypothetical protein Natoc_0241 [Natronococcus occultus SP4]
MEPLPTHLETAIYGYFLLVAAVGCYLHLRIQASARRTRDDEPARDAERPDGSSP